jgi:hypothetical protein
MSEAQFVSQFQGLLSLFTAFIPSERVVVDDLAT